MPIKASLHIMRIMVVLGALFVAFSSSADAAYLRDFPVTVTQPDGAVLNLFVSGDEYHNWLHDRDGYTVMRDPATGYLVYALKTSKGLTASRYRVGEVAPASVGLERKVNISPEEALAKRLARIRESSLLPPAPAPKTGTINNIVIFIRFSDEAEFTDPIATYDSMFNAGSAGASSLYNYFEEASYNQLTVSTTFYPTPTTTVVSYQDSQPRAYYQPYNAVTNLLGYDDDTYPGQSTAREHTLLKNAVDAVSSMVPPGLNVDGDGDGDVDNVCFIVSGSPDGWSDLLWPHMWALYSLTANINGKRVYTYNLQLQNSLLPSNVGVLAHEMFHSIGAPDLYHYSYDGLHPVWAWDLMEADQNPPQHMGAYMKKTYGSWIASIPEITAPGTYSLNPLTSATNNAYKIASPNSATEYFVVEYRKKTTTFENSLPGEGLLVYRINTTVTQGNRNGPPDAVYIYRPGGTTTLDGTPANAPFSSNSGRTTITDSTDPSGFLSSGLAGGLEISAVSAIGDTISFQVSFPSTDVTPPGMTTSAASAILQDGATLNGLADPNNASTTVTFEYGTTTAYGNTVTADQSPVTGNALTPVSKAITGLSPYTVYHYRVKGVNSAGTSYGGDMTFTTAPYCALLRDGGFEGGTPNSFWAEASIVFGTPLCNPAYCGYTAARTGSWWAWFGGVAANETGMLTQSVTIPSGTAPTLGFYLWIPDSSGNGTDFLKVKVDGAVVFTALEGNATYTGDYTLAQVDLSAYADGAAHAIRLESTITGSPVLSNFFVDDVSISCAPPPPPVVTTTAASSVATAGATLNGTVNANNSSATATFEYGTTAAYGSSVAADQSPVTGGAETPVSRAVNGLNSDTLYHFRLKGQSAAGTSYGNDLSFYTGACQGSPAVRIGTTPKVSLQAAVTDAGDSQTVEATSSPFAEVITVSGDGTITLRGGFDCGFGSNPNFTTVVGSITFTGNRTVIVDKIIVL